MARGYGSIAPGVAALAFLALVAGGAALGLALAAFSDPEGAAAAFDARLVSVVRFTLGQAGLSTALTVPPAAALALAFNRRAEFPGRALALRLMALPLALPAIVMAFAILALFGRSGLLASALDAIGVAHWPGVYGLSGILIAHVAFNLPLAARLLLASLAAVPANHYRLAAELGFGEGALLRFVEWPALKAALPGVALLVAMLCMTSFTIVLLLGGGPAATTLEVEIYQALRFDFDPARAGALVVVQVVLTAAAAWAARAGEYRADPDAALKRRPRRQVGKAMLLADVLIVGLAILLVGAPLAAVAVSGLAADLTRLAGEASVRRAAATSLGVGLASATIAVAAALALATSRKTLADRGSPLAGLFGRGALLILVAPTTALGAGWFLAINRFADPSGFALAIVVAVNAAMALPFAFNALRPAHDAARDRHDRLCMSLGVAGLERWRIIDWPVLKRPLASALAFAFALSLGDLGVIALFGSDTVQTLPWLTLARLGVYRTDDAAGLALLLAIGCLAAMALSDRLASGARP